jgi:hypothetical protein
LRNFPVLLMTVGALLSVACGPESPANETPSADGAAPSVALPEREPVPELLSYDETALGIPLRARYPDRLDVSSMASGEGVGVFFTFKAQGDALDNAELQVFLPAGGTSPSELVELTTSAGGLIESSGWSVDATREAGTTEFAYPWAETVIDIIPAADEFGHILVGGTHGQALRTTLRYPTAQAEQYWHLVRPVLDSIEFDADLLPIPASED